ncbi:hypothetical protein Bbelb_419110 [Branchiostoma belcheri]|nr:hypothetical protein Bbelb_419110 [Branchiostoma belcheri]
MERVYDQAPLAAAPLLAALDWERTASRTKMHRSIRGSWTRLIPQVLSGANVCSPPSADPISCTVHAGNKRVIVEAAAAEIERRTGINGVHDSQNLTREARRRICHPCRGNDEENSAVAACQSYHSSGGGMKLHRDRPYQFPVLSFCEPPTELVKI